MSSQLRKPKANVSYRIVAEAPGLPSVSAISMAPVPPVIQDAELLELGTVNAFGDTEYLVSFRLENRPGLNYYSFSIFLAFPDTGSPGSSAYSVYGILMNHDSPSWTCSFSDILNPVFMEARNDYGCTLGIFSDRFVDDPALVFEIKVGVLTGLENLVEADLILFLMALSPEYVEYHGSLEEHDDFGEFGEPANLYTNLQGGHGIFAGYSASYQFFNLVVME